jgi:hypothetical protein
MKRLFVLIALAFTGLLTALCLFSAAASMSSDKLAGLAPAVIGEAAAKVAKFDLPAGYRPSCGIDMAGFELAGYTSESSNTHIIVSQAPVLTEKLPGMDEYTWYEINMHVTRRETIVVRGRPAQAQYSEGTGSGGETYQQVAVVFAGEEGPALSTITGPVSEWETAEVNAFLSSIH